MTTPKTPTAATPEAATTPGAANTPERPKTERTVILVRHAQASHIEGERDHDRKLTSRGRQDARAIGRWLSESTRPVVLDLALCSTAERTRQTLEGVRAGGGSATDVRFDDRIYDASAANLLAVLHEVPDSVNAVLMIGHAPGIPVLATALARDDSAPTEVFDNLARKFPTSSLAVLGFDGRWSELAPEAAYLQDFVVARG